MITTIDTLYHIEIPNPPYTAEMPACEGTWRELPAPLPEGSYAIVFTARVEQPGASLTLTLDGNKFAVVHYPVTRNWECVPNPDVA